jgi:hypothetical protein
MAIDKGRGVWPFLNRRQRIAIYILTVGLAPWILYNKIRGRE